MNQFLKRLGDWEKRFDEWLAENRDETVIITCIEYAKERGSLDGWADQVRANMAERARMKRRYCKEVEEMFLENGVGVVEFIG